MSEQVFLLMGRFGRCLHVDTPCTVEANKGAKKGREIFMFKVVDWKTAQPKSRVLCFVWWTFISPRKEVRRRIYRSFAAKTRWSESQRLLLMKENQKSQDNEFSAFLCMGRCRSLGSLKSIPLICTLSRVIILFVLLMSPLMVHHWGWLQWLRAASSPFFSYQVLSGLTVGEAKAAWWL